MRTIGDGSRGFNRARPTEIVARASTVLPSASVTSRRTRCAPAVVNLVVKTGPPETNGPLPAGSHAKATIARDPPAEVETSETVSPTTGDAGIHVNDAVGWTSVGSCMYATRSLYTTHPVASPDSTTLVSTH